MPELTPHQVKKFIAFVAMCDLDDGGSAMLENWLVEKWSALNLIKWSYHRGREQYYTLTQEGSEFAESLPEVQQVRQQRAEAEERRQLDMKRREAERNDILSQQLSAFGDMLFSDWLKAQVGFNGYIIATLNPRRSTVVEFYAWSQQRQRFEEIGLRVYRTEFFDWESYREAQECGEVEDRDQYRKQVFEVSISSQSATHDYELVREYSRAIAAAADMATIFSAANWQF
jgi:hypothetical protein